MAILSRLSRFVTRPGNLLALGSALTLALVIPGLAGCGSDQFTPANLPTPTSSNDETGLRAEEGSVPTIAVIIPREGLVDSTVWEQSARLLIPQSNALSDVTKSEKRGQGRAVRDAVMKGASAVILVAPDATEPDLATMVKDAREFTIASRGRPTPIILATKGLEGLGTEFPIVRFSPLEDSVRELVTAAVEDAKKAGYGDHPKAVILYNGPYDEEGHARVAAARQALNEAQVELLTDAAFEGYQAEAAEAVKKVVEAHPDLGVLISTDDQGARAAATIRDQMDKSQKRFAMGVIGPRKDLERLIEFNIIAGHLIRDNTILARQAILNAIKMANGEPVPPESLEINAPFIRASGPEREGFAPKIMSPSEEEEPEPRPGRSFLKGKK